jgi:hypothetical protein
MNVVIRIAITRAAYAAIAATLPGSVGVERQRAPNGDYFIWLAPAVVNRRPPPSPLRQRALAGRIGAGSKTSFGRCVSALFLRETTSCAQFFQCS